MISKKKVPPHKKKTPTNCPELLDVWRNRYTELRESYLKWACLEMIGKEYGINRTTVEYHLFPERKMKLRNFDSRKWAYEKAVPKIRQKRVDYKRQYMFVRYHIDDHIQQAYSCVPMNGSLTLDDLSRSIELQSGIALAPDTILGLDRKYLEKHGRNLIGRLLGGSPRRYRLVFDE